jgi:hypothetical protein
MGTGRDFLTVVGVEEEERVASEPRATTAVAAADAVALEATDDTAAHATRLPISANTTARATLVVGFDLAK